MTHMRKMDALEVRLSDTIVKEPPLPWEKVETHHRGGLILHEYARRPLLVLASVNALRGTHCYVYDVSLSRFTNKPRPSLPRDEQRVRSDFFKPGCTIWRFASSSRLHTVHLVVVAGPDATAEQQARGVLEEMYR